MNTKKGMSQTLALIVAASVLMMTALTVIFLAQGSLGDFGSQSRASACTQAVQSSCQAALSTSNGNSELIQAPGSCVSEQDSTAGDEVPISGAENSIDPHSFDESGQSLRVTCNAN